MKTAKQRLTPTTKPTTPKQIVHLRQPKIEIPPPQVHVETVQFANALNKVEQTLQSVLQAMAAHDARLVRTTETLTSLLKQLAKQDIKVDMPDIVIPERPTSFSVFVDDGGEPIEMRIQTNSRN
jgi:hypothetical protein